MGPGKTPAPNGVHTVFYQKYWDIVGEETTKMCMGILSDGNDVSLINKIYITPISKVIEPKHMSEFRPTSLYNVSYKIVVKSLANRMKKVWDVIIFPSYSAFFLERLITDNAILGFEYEFHYELCGVVCFVVLINRSPQEEFVPYRELHQGSTGTA
ncbi:uncharacterized protein LOC120067528 [Benincasa hispida]|uniref:uncharacterized protein LOC120067528 n=1 Tax=Benincasa hispida TaxID=102211 RepID=UPI001901E814|nr:uncharacterized protein LOC120067528 [Benincasa hispida]